MFLSLRKLIVQIESREREENHSCANKIDRRKRKYKWVIICVHKNFISFIKDTSEVIIIKLLT